MGTTELLIAVVALVLPLAVVGAVLIVAIRVNRRRGDIRITRTPNPLLEQYEARTPAGPAIITKVVDDRGPAYEIETSFRGERTRLHYVVPSMSRVRYLLDVRVAAYLAEREASR